ncbi:DNA polymerase III subunit beta [candidate division WWE3 bacterium RIFCSPHIGHO2_01_FULL_48_15]|uniref:Beta sliding clamp n=1 Tax=candidate division WWE3 bacterium RIFCSPHIGHO2_01_FULL_48_15 TaxID=1802619 RepID=A0A1F4VCH1_UNCKA|nr:MAG: DNA polymerase III subunit beta [candidate division WWE3 bacterium RIFCSPHIGHO2_01_FULL_48_15]
MKVTVLQENFLPKLQAVARIASSKSALPVLENVLLEAQKGVLTISASNLETSIKTNVGAKVEEVGATTVPARILVSLVSNLPAGKLELDAQRDILTLKTEGVSSKVNGLPAAEFPAFSEEGKKIFALEAKVFKEAVTQVSFAAAADESRPILTGLLLKLTNGILTLTGVDGFRLAEKEVKAEGDGISLVIPARSLVEVARLIDGEVEVSMPAAGQLFFKTADFAISVSAIEGEFPDYEQIIPANFETRFSFSKEELAKAVQLTSVFSESGVGVVALNFDPGKKSLEVSSQEGETGEAKIEVAIAGEGKQGTIAFNSRYLTDALSALAGEEVTLSLNSPMDPALFADPADKAYLHVVMPVRIQG